MAHIGSPMALMRSNLCKQAKEPAMTQDNNPMSQRIYSSISQINLSDTFAYIEPELNDDPQTRLMAIFLSY